MRRALLASGLVVLLASAPALARSAAPGHHRFSAHVTNALFPMRPGTTWVYRGIEGGTPARDVVHATHRTVRIDGASCVVVHDRLVKHGRVVERTSDFYTQDETGTVWYFGENTAELDRHGHVVSREGTWRAGVRGARPGVIMPAHPRVGQFFHQEDFAGHAEDRFRVVAVVPGARSGQAPQLVRTREWTPLEPGVIDQKVYARGIGSVHEETVKGGEERLELVSMRRGR
jgi:hypothetical protein